jgi:chromosome segregation ATPase
MFWKCSFRAQVGCFVLALCALFLLQGASAKRNVLLQKKSAMQARRSLLEAIIDIEVAQASVAALGGLMVKALGSLSEQKKSVESLQKQFGQVSTFVECMEGKQEIMAVQNEALSAAVAQMQVHIDGLEQDQRLSVAKISDMTQEISDLLVAQAQLVSDNEGLQGVMGQMESSLDEIVVAMQENSLLREQMAEAFDRLNAVVSHDFALQELELGAWQERAAAQLDSFVCP